MGYRKAMDVLPPDVLEKLQDYLAGMSFHQLANKYFLAEKSIQRIIRQQRQK